LTTSTGDVFPITTQTDRLEGYLKTVSHGAEFQISHLNSINRLLGGFERKKMVVLGSRPSEGKSTFALQTAYELSSKHKILYLSLEMTIEESMFRLFCYEMRIANTDFFSGRMYDYQKSFEEFKSKISSEQRLLIIGEEIGKTWEEIDSVFSKMNSKPDMVILDYVQCIRSNGKRLEAIEDYIKKFRALAIQEEFCLVLCSQINRANLQDNKSKEPTMEGLKNTGFLEEHADKVILLHYPCKHKEEDITKFKVIVAKNKNGMTGYVNCRITPEHYRIWEEGIVEEKQEELQEWEE
jgi:replicative DNA helicase